MLVTDRGKPVAKIVPVKTGKLKLPHHLLELERAGLVCIGKGKLSREFWDMPRPKDKRGLPSKVF